MIFVYALAVAFAIRTLQYVVTFINVNIFDNMGLVMHILCVAGGALLTWNLDLRWWWAIAIALLADFLVNLRSVLDDVIVLCRLSVLKQGKPRS